LGGRKFSLTVGGSQFHQAKWKVSSLPRQITYFNLPAIIFNLYAVSLAYNKDTLSMLENVPGQVSILGTETKNLTYSRRN
ncbi:hypothetical protein TNCT_98251, partial [Trichonephila clavata]